MAAYRRVYDSCHLQADCQEPESAPDSYARLSSMATVTFLFHWRVRVQSLHQNLALYDMYTARQKKGTYFLLRSSF